MKGQVCVYTHAPSLELTLQHVHMFDSVSSSITHANRDDIKFE